MVWGGGGGKHLNSALTKALIAGSIGKDKVGSGKGLYLHKGLDRCNKKGVTFSPLETPAIDFALCWGMKDHSSTVKKSSHGGMARRPQQSCPLLLLDVPAPISLSVQV